MNTKRRRRVSSWLAWLALNLAFAVSVASAGEDTAKPNNTALIPTPKLEDDSYDWYARHEAVLKLQGSLRPEIVLIGDSITHFWAGPPESPRQSGPESWRQLFGNRAVLNMGFGWDRTQNVLWRLKHGELEGVQPRWVVLNIGTNNFTGTVHARTNTPAEVAEAIGAILDRVHEKSPQSRLILMGVFPRGQKPDDPLRAPIQELNRLLPEVAKSHEAVFVDIGSQFLEADGTIPAARMFDFCHPSEQGYALWAAALRPYLGDGAEGGNSK